MLRHVESHEGSKARAFALSRRGANDRVGRRTSGIAFFLVVGGVTVAGPATMDIYLPGLPNVAHDLSTSPSATQFTIATYLVGMALGFFLSGPISDVHGRRLPLMWGMAIFAAASLVCAVAPSVYVLAAARLVQGATAASGMAIGRAIVRDLYSGVAAAWYLSRLMLVVGLGPVVAPLVGAQMLRVTSWRGVFVVLAVLGLLLVATVARLLPETLPRERRRPSGSTETARSFGRLLFDRGFVGYVCICGFGAGAVTGYVAGSSFVLQDVYGASPQLYSVLFGMNGFFLVAGAQLNARLLRTRSPRHLLGAGLTMIAVAGGVLLVVVQFPGAGLASVVPPLTLVMFGWSFVQSNGVALAMTDHPHVAGTASGLLGASQSFFGALMAPLVGIGSRTTGLSMAVVVAICAVGALLSLRYLVTRVRRPDVAVTPSEA